MNDDDQPKNKLGYEGEPDYSTLEGARKQESGEHDPVTPRARAASAASSAEKAASASDKISGAPTLAAGDAAKIYKADFKNTVKGVEKGMNQKGLKGNVAKKAAPIVGVLLLVLLPLIAVGSLVAMPFHLLENLKNGFLSLFGANATNAVDSYAAMLDANPDLAGTIGKESGYGGVSQEVCDELYAHNIEVINGCTPTELQEGSGSTEGSYYLQKAIDTGEIALSPSSSDAGGGGTMYFKFTDSEGETHEYKTPEELRSAFKSNLEFNDAMTRGSLSFTGSFSGWFDDMTQQLMKNLDLHRNSFQDFYEDIEDLESSAQIYREIINEINKRGEEDTNECTDENKCTMQHDDRDSLSPRKHDHSGEGNSKTCSCSGDSLGVIQEKDQARMMYLKEKTDSDLLIDKGIEVLVYCTLPEGSVASWEWEMDTKYDEYIKNNKGDKCYDSNGNPAQCEVAFHIVYKTATIARVGEALKDVEERITAYLPEVSRGFMKTLEGKGSQELCSQLYSISYFSSIVAANRLQQAADFASKALEAIDKTRAGYGTESPINEFAGSLSRWGVYEYLDDDGVEVNSDTDLPGLNASALTWSTTGSKVELNDPNIKKLSLEGTIKGATLTAETITKCAMLDIIGEFLHGLISLVLGRDLIFAEPEDKNASPETLLIEAKRRAAYGFIFNPCTESPNEDGELTLANGEDIGNCISLGSHYYMSKNHQMAGGSPGDREKVLEFSREYYTVIGKQAERERADRSPFDISSQYTFLGSIVNQIVPYTATLTNSNIFNSIGTIVSSSIKSLLPTASALNEEAVLGNIGKCDYLRGIGSIDGGSVSEEAGAVGDAFCVPYMILDLDPKEIKKVTGSEEIDIKKIEKAIDEKYNGFGDEKGKKVDDNGNPIIKARSNFARYIKYCSNRLSIFGIIDSNILQDYINEMMEEKKENQKKNIFVRVFYALINLLLGEDRQRALALLDNKTDALSWATGRYCVATNNEGENEGLNPKWEENQFYQYYMHFQRINVNRGGYEYNNSLEPIKQFEESTAENSLIPNETVTVARTAGMIPEDYVILEHYLAYQILDKSSYGPNIASIAIADAPVMPEFRRSITPLTDFFIDNILPALRTPIIDDPRTQGVTA